MKKFTGTIRITICEASGLKPTDFQTRHNMTFGKPADEQPMDPYVSIDVDDSHFGNSKLLFMYFRPPKLLISYHFFFFNIYFSLMYLCVPSSITHISSLRRLLLLLFLFFAPIICH